LQKIPFQLFEAFGAFVAFFRAVSFLVAQGPEIVTIDKHGVNNFSVPFGCIELGAAMGAVHVILLCLGPQCGDASADEMIPTDGFLGRYELVVLRRKVDDFGGREIGVREKGTHAGEHDMSKFWISFGGLSLFADGRDERRLPPAARDGLALKHVVV
jgi:hypothetical protein